MAWRMIPRRFNMPTQGVLLHFPPRTYRITQPIEIKLSEHGPLGIDGTSGTARVVMDGKDGVPVGTHGGTGDPGSRRQRRLTSTPTNHPQYRGERRARGG